MIPTSLATITSVSNDPAGPWSGTTPEVAKAYYQGVYEAGVASQVTYGIELIPFYDDSLLATSDIQLYSSSDLHRLLAKMRSSGLSSAPTPSDNAIPLSSPDNFSKVLPWLAQSIAFSSLSSQVDSVQIGSQQLNYFNGVTSPPITVNFIETRNYSISNSIQAIRSIMFPKDGTQALPKDYLMRMKIYSYDREIRAVRPYEVNYVVAIESDSLNFDATGVSASMIIPITFSCMFPFFANDNTNEILG